MNAGDSGRCFDVRQRVRRWDGDAARRRGGECRAADAAASSRRERQLPGRALHRVLRVLRAAGRVAERAACALGVAARAARGYGAARGLGRGAACAVHAAGAAAVAAAAWRGGGRQGRNAGAGREGGEGEVLWQQAVARARHGPGGGGGRAGREWYTVHARTNVERRGLVMGIRRRRQRAGSRRQGAEGGAREGDGVEGPGGDAFSSGQ